MCTFVLVAINVDGDLTMDENRRFPHRNAPLGRESTPEESEWLKSDDVPEWAKSQAAPAPP